MNALYKKMKANNDNVDIARMDERIKNIQDRLEDLIKKIDSNYVTKVEFVSEVAPIKKIVYGVVSLILVSVVVAILGLILKK